MNRKQLSLIFMTLVGAVLNTNVSARNSGVSNRDWSSCFDDEKPHCNWHNGIYCDASTDMSRLDACYCTLNSKLDALCSDDFCEDELCSDTDMCCCGIESKLEDLYSQIENGKVDSLVCEQKRANLVFTAPDMNKTGQNPDTSFNNVYNGMNFSLQAWKMLPGSNSQQEISLLFGLPNNYDVTKPFEVTLYLFVQKNSGSSGDTGNIRIRIDSKNSLQDLGPDFLMTVTTGDFAITEPLGVQNVQTLIVKKECMAPLLLPGGLLVLVFDRILPTVCTDIKCPVCTQDYNKNIFLESVIFSFYEHECL